MARDLLLRLSDVRKSFRVGRSGTVRAVNGINLSIHRGETLGLVGESGCGKTTLGRLIVKLYRPDSGTIDYCGKDIWGMSEKEQLAYRKKVQMIFQDPYASLDPLSVVGDSIAEGLDIHGIRTGKARRQRVLELLRMVGLGAEHANRFPHELSGGQRQRVGIARALAVEPELIVCDEPISALDVSVQAQIVNLLIGLQKEMGLSYLFISHDLSMVKHIADRVAVMYLGSIVELAPSNTLYASHRHPYTQALLSAVPIANPKLERQRKRTLLSGDVPSPIGLREGCAFSPRCPVTMDICQTRAPVLEEVEPGHFVACHWVGSSRCRES